ncbi:MAG: hypothetical protein DLM67_25210 [Candidatus Nephthysia bennettiae]|nr:MAG: hypothetical protein DLM67_25210 [Candidatus Dormibacteraeota bacterium]
MLVLIHDQDPVQLMLGRQLARLSLLLIGADGDHSAALPAPTAAPSPPGIIFQGRIEHTRLGLDGGHFSGHLSLTNAISHLLGLVVGCSSPA